jgi:hypothetical protein
LGIGHIRFSIGGSPGISFRTGGNKTDSFFFAKFGVATPGAGFDTRIEFSASVSLSEMFFPVT